MRFDIWEQDRARARVLDNGLKVLESEGPIGPERKTGYFLMVWKPKGKNPFVNTWFPDHEKRQQYLDRIMAGHDEHKQRMSEWKEKRKGTPEDLEKVRPGDIFAWSWGYDQTNLDFYQVVERNGKKLTLREIAQETVPGSEGFMSDSRTPVKDQFLADGETITKVIQFSNGEPYISMDHGWCGLWDGKPHYCSWYA